MLRSGSLCGWLRQVSSRKYKILILKTRDLKNLFLFLHIERKMAQKLSFSADKINLNKALIKMK